MKNLLKYGLVVLATVASTGLLWADSITSGDSVRVAKIIAANDSTQSQVQNVDALSQQSDSDGVVAKHESIKKKSAKTQQKSNHLRTETKKTTDTSLELSSKKDTAKSQTRDSVQTEANQDSVDSILTKKETNSCDTISNGREYTYKGKIVPQVLSEWAFPLIIMLFAFGFPFIFNGITRLEEKYHSEELSTIIKDSGVYRYYKYMLVISVFSSALYCLGLLLPNWNVAWVLYVGYIFKIIGTVIVTISAILFIIATILLVRDLFLYNDATKLFVEWNDKWNINEKEDTTTRIILSLYDYALRQEKKDLLNAVENKLLSLVEAYRSDKAPKNNKRNALDYSKSLLNYLYTLYENTLKTSNPQYQNRVIRLYCEVIFDRTNTSEDLPKTILSNNILEHFWKMSKITTQYKAEQAFAILWAHLADYYCLLVNHDNTVKEQENILDLCFVIGALNYIKKAGTNLEFALSYTIGYFKNEKMSFTRIEDVLYRYYRCTGDYAFAKSDSTEAYEKYKIYDYEKATKKQQIAPLTQYVVFLLLRIYNQSPHFMQFDPIALRNKLFDQHNYRLTPNIVELIQNKSLTSIEKSIFQIKKIMSKEDIESFTRNLMTSSKRSENIRLADTPISEYCQQQFENRLKQELHVTCYDLKKLVRAPKRQVQYGFCTSGSTALSYVDDTQQTIDFMTSGQDDLVKETIFEEPITVVKPKATFVYASFLQSSENIFSTAKIISESVYRTHINKIASMLLSMKKGNASWVTNNEELSKKLKAIIQEKDLIIYIAPKDESNIYAPISMLKKDKAYQYDHGQSTYNKLPILILNGKELDQEVYDKIYSSFIALNRSELPEINPNKLINDISSYTLDYKDYRDIDAAMLKISISSDATLIYQKNICKFIRVKHVKSNS